MLHPSPAARLVVVFISTPLEKGSRRAVGIDQPALTGTGSAGGDHPASSCQPLGSRRDPTPAATFVVVLISTLQSEGSRCAVGIDPRSLAGADAAGGGHLRAPNGVMWQGCPITVSGHRRDRSSTPSRPALRWWCSSRLLLVSRVGRCGSRRPPPPWSWSSSPCSCRGLRRAVGIDQAPLAGADSAGGVHLATSRRGGGGWPFGSLPRPSQARTPLPLLVSASRGGRARARLGNRGPAVPVADMTAHG